MVFQNKTAMVTGAGRNIGREIALSFAREGANVIVCDVNEENARATAAEIEALRPQAQQALDRLWSGNEPMTGWVTLPVNRNEDIQGQDVQPLPWPVLWVFSCNPLHLPSSWT